MVNNSNTWKEEGRKKYVDEGKKSKKKPKKEIKKKVRLLSY